MSKSDQHENFLVNDLLHQISLENVTLKTFGKDPILQAVDMYLPIDQTMVIESSNPQNAVYFLQFLAGRMNCDSGRILWNGENIFSSDSTADVKKILTSYFETHFADRDQTVGALLSSTDFNLMEYDIFEQFEIESLKKEKIKNLSYEMSKTVFLIQTVLGSPQALILEDPAMGLSEFNWLQFLDLIQYQQRRGYLRHIYMTNHHPTALRHLAYNKVFLEDGLIYFDENAGYKKASHF